MNLRNILHITGEEITLEYQFLVDSELEPEKFRLAHTVFYESDKKQYSTTFYNMVSWILRSIFFYQNEILRYTCLSLLSIAPYRPIFVLLWDTIDGCKEFEFLFSFYWSVEIVQESVVHDPQKIHFALYLEFNDQFNDQYIFCLIAYVGYVIANL